MRKCDPNLRGPPTSFSAVASDAAGMAALLRAYDSSGGSEGEEEDARFPLFAYAAARVPPEAEARVKALVERAGEAVPGLEALAMPDVGMQEHARDAHVGMHVSLCHASSVGRAQIRPLVDDARRRVQRCVARKDKGAAITAALSLDAVAFPGGAGGRTSYLALPVITDDPSSARLVALASALDATACAFHLPPYHGGGFQLHVSVAATSAPLRLLAAALAHLAPTGQRAAATVSAVRLNVGKHVHVLL